MVILKTNIIYGLVIAKIENLIKNGGASMAWLCVSQDNVELVFQDKPTKMEEWGFMMFDSITDNKSFVALPKGSIKKLIGRDLSWSDEPVELK